jgi:hypothetical protein
MVCLGILITIYAASMLAPWIAPYPRDAIALGNAYSTPFQYRNRWLISFWAPDHLGRDLFTRLIYAAAGIARRLAFDRRNDFDTDWDHDRASGRVFWGMDRQSRYSFY